MKTESCERAEDSSYSNTPLTNLQIIFANQQILLKNEYKKDLGHRSQSKFRKRTNWRGFNSTGTFYTKMLIIYIAKSWTITC